MSDLTQRIAGLSPEKRKELLARLQKKNGKVAFFDIGGHSLLSMKVIYEIEKKLNIQINPREIMFKNLGQLAVFCEELSNSETSSKGFGKRLLKRFKKETSNIN